MKGVTLDTQERKARFTELMASIELLGDPDNDDYSPTLPDGTKGLSDGNLKAAILAQAIRHAEQEDEEFVGNLINALANTGFSACVDKTNNEQTPNEDDLSACTMAIHIAWAVGAFMPMALMMGSYARMLHDIDVDVPEDLLLILRPNTPVVKGSQKHDPIALLDMDFSDLLEDLLKRAK
jgi:uncharacterized membrane protein